MDIGSQKFTSNNNNKLKILGVTINPSLSCQGVMQECLRSCHFCLLKLSSIRNYLDRPSKIKLVQSNILNRIDYCNISYACANKGDIKYLQNGLKAAVRFIYSLDIQIAITSFAKYYPFLLVKFRVLFNYNVIVFKMYKYINTSSLG